MPWWRSFGFGTAPPGGPWPTQPHRSSRPSPRFQRSRGDWFAVGMAPGVVRRRTAREGRGRRHRPRRRRSCRSWAAPPGCAGVAAGALFVIAATPLAGPPATSPPTTLGARADQERPLRRRSPASSSCRASSRPADGRYVRCAVATACRGTWDTCPTASSACTCCCSSVIADWLRPAALRGQRHRAVRCSRWSASLLVSEVLLPRRRAPGAAAARRLAAAGPRSSDHERRRAPRPPRSWGSDQRARPAVRPSPAAATQ